MAIFEVTRDAIIPLAETTLAERRIRERQDLQRLLRHQIEIVSPGTYVIAEEYSAWEDARRSIDLLCLDKEANLVVIELKRTEDGGHMDLQAIRYAAMVSTMTFSQAVEAHTRYLSTLGSDEDAQEAILKFLDWEEPREKEFAQDVRIVLVSADFSKEITTSVMWLNAREMDIRCVKLRPYALESRTLLDIQQVIPLPEAAAYQVQIRRKAAEERQSHEQGSDWSRFDLHDGQDVYSNLTKRRLFYQVVRSLWGRGITLDDFSRVFNPGKFLQVPGKLNASQFLEAAERARRSNGTRYDLRRYFADPTEVFFSDDVTWVLSNQWGRDELHLLDKLIAEKANGLVSYKKVSE